MHRPIRNIKHVPLGRAHRLIDGLLDHDEISRFQSAGPDLAGQRKSPPPALRINWRPAPALSVVRQTSPPYLPTEFENSVY